MAVTQGHNFGESRKLGDGNRESAGTEANKTREPVLLFSNLQYKK